MTAKPKVFCGTGLFIPVPWLRALDLPPHVQQCAVTAVAPTKTGLAEMLAERGLHQVTAGRLSAAMSLARRFSVPDEALIAAGVITPGEPGIWAYRDYVRDRAVIRIDPDGSPVVVAHFRQQRGYGHLAVELED
jgi:hypothetical protein